MAYKCVLLLLACCIIALAAANPMPGADPDEHKKAPYNLVRQARKPGGGSVDLTYQQDQAGKSAQVQYNQNLHTSSDGRFKVDAYAQASRDFTHNRNDYGGGVQGSYSF